MNGSAPRVPSDGPIPAEILADLQAGLLDDATAAQVRRRIRSDPQAGPEARTTLAALDRVRRDLADLGRDTSSAAPVPVEVSARLFEALRAEPSVPWRRRWKRLGALIGAGAAVVAIVVGGVVLLRPAGSTPSTLTSVGQITVAPPRGSIGLSESEIQGLLAQPPDLRPLTRPRLTACLSKVGYPPDVEILGARPLEVAGRPGVLALVPLTAPADPDTVDALVVAADCDAGHATLLARTVVQRPVKRP